MPRDHVLMVTLCAIVLLNIIAIILLNNRLADQEAALAQRTSAVAPSAASAAVIMPESPIVRTVLLADSTCRDCFNISTYVDELNDTIRMDVSRAAQSDLAQFNATRLPALAFDARLESYPRLVTGWHEVGTRVTIADGQYAGTWYVLPTQNPPYLDVASDIVRGRVSVTYITKNSCEECYDVAVTRAFLEDSRIAPWHETFIDADSVQGRVLIKRHNITSVPTIMMNEEASVYANLQPGWNIVGTVEDDGTYVLRDLRRLGVIYYDTEQQKMLVP